MNSGVRALRPTRAEGTRWKGALAITLIALGSVATRTAFHAPPRFDGAGYAVLAQSLLRGEGYRAIDHPDRPLHAHYPPGYPLALATLWRVTGVSATAAHGFSVVCTTLAVWLSYRWLTRRTALDVALVLGLALAVNWSWGRNGGGIQSEPLFLFLVALSLNVHERALRGSWRWGILLGVVLAAATLTRHVGMMLALGAVYDLIRRRRWDLAGATGSGLACALAPWVAWLARVGRGTQHELLNPMAAAGLISRLLPFYIERLPDQVTGPLVEVGTVFRPELGGLVRTWAVAVTGVIVLGWFLQLRHAKWRVSGATCVATLSLLLVWPFTEAGRFLVPLVPFILTGCAHGLASLMSHVARRPRRAMRLAASLVLAASIPYSAYTSARGRGGETAHADFDAACAWVGRQAGARPVLVRQSGEAFWLMGRERPALAPPDRADAAEIDRLIDRYHIEYLILDAARYVNADRSALEAYAEKRQGTLERAAAFGAIRVFRVLPTSR